MPGTGKTNLSLSKLFRYLAAFVLAGCASRVPPDGGPRDRTAPIVLNTIPQNKAVEVNTTKFEFVFDEFIQLKDGGSRILISPPVQKSPDVLVQGKKLILKLREPLDSLTTYTITPGAGVTDLNEGNPLEPYSLVFSTGSKLDSLGCRGRLTNAFNAESVKDALVMLYRDDIDSLPKSKLPRYFARTNEAGQYEIQNVKAGTYKMFALKDQNTNYLYDQPGELIGFPEQLISIDSAGTPIPEIRLSAEEASVQRLVKSEYEEPGKVILKYSIAPDTVYFTDFSGNGLEFFRTDESMPDSLNILFNRFAGDSIRLFAHSKLKGVSRIDTLEFRARKIKPAGRKGNRNTGRDTALIFSSNIEAKKLLPAEKLILNSNYPCQLSDSADFRWIVAGDTSAASLPESLSPFSFEFIPPSAESKAIYLIGAPGSFKDIYGHTSDTIMTDFRVMAEDETGNLEIVVSDSANSGKLVILELTDSKGVVKFKKSISGNDSLLIRNLRPGSLRLRAIVDENENGKWDPANYDLKTQPETVIRYSEEITIRAGWDLAVEWDIFARPVQKKRPDKPASD